MTRPDDFAFPDSTACGLTKQEYFAAMAMQGLLASGDTYKNLTQEAVWLADRLINELNEP